jgi:hypothetical protein
MASIVHYVEFSLSSIPEPSYGNLYTGPDANGLLFASPGAIRFPVPNTEAWREKV